MLSSTLSLLLTATSGLLSATAATAATTATAASTTTTTNNNKHEGSKGELRHHRVRKLLSVDADSHHRQDFIGDITFSDEGHPLDLPDFSIVLKPTPASGLNDEADIAIELAMSDYLLEEFSNSKALEGAPELTTVDVAVIGTETILSTSNVLMEATLLFAEEEPLPSDATVAEILNESLKNLDKFVQDYLSQYLTVDLEDVSEADFIDPTTTAPTQAPVGNSISEVNEAIQVSQTNRELKTILPAAVAGVAAFFLTVLFLGHRRSKVAGMEDGYSSKGNDYSVQYLDSTDDSEVRKQRQANKANRMQSIPMEDGFTTVHVPPVISANSSGMYDASPPMIVSTASAVGSSFDELDYTSTMIGQETTRNPATYHFEDEVATKPATNGFFDCDC